MARLKSRVVPEENFELEIVPIYPSLAGPHDAYRVRVWKNDQEVFDKIYSVHGRQQGHFITARIARAFQLAPALVGERVPFHLYDPRKEIAPRYYEPVCIREDINWLGITLWAQLLGKTAYAYLLVDLRTDTDYPDTSLVLVSQQRVPMNCSPEAVQAFGVELEAELQTARRLRTEMGMATHDDVW